MYFLLIVIISLLAIFTFKLYTNDLLCPASIVLLMFLICSISGLMQWKEYNYIEYSATSVFYILLGIFTFLLGCIIPYILYSHQINHLLSNAREQRKERIEISPLILLIAIFISLIAIVLFYKFEAATVGMSTSPISNLPKIINKYHYAEQFWDTVNMPSSLNYLLKAGQIFSTLSVFVLIYNSSFKVFNKKDIYHMVIIFLYLILCILRSNRGSILILLSLAVYFLYFFWNMYYGWKSSVNRKIMKWMIMAAISFLILFFVLILITGRKQSLAEINIRSYLWAYTGGGIRCFDLFIKNPVHSNDMFGYETFFSINRALYNFFGRGSAYLRHLEFRQINGVDISNVYTSFRRFYSDFGIGGLIILPLIQGLLFTTLYMYCKKRALKGQITFGILLFGYLSHSLFYMPIDDMFYSSVLAVGSAPRVLILYILFKYLPRIQFQKRIK